MTRTKSSRALLSVVLAVLMAAAFMPSLTYSSFAATAKKATKVTKASHADKAKFTRTVGTAWTLKYKLSPSKLTSSAKKVTWKSSNSKVAKITTIKSGKAVVSFKSTGSATVTVATKANPKAKTSWKFKVVKKAAKKDQTALTGVTVSKNGVALTDTTAIKAGDTLKASVAPAGATASYQWFADDKAIEGATDDTYTVTNEVAGKTISVKATGVGDYKDTVESAKSAKATAVALKDVTIKTTDANKALVKATADDAVVGKTLTAVVDPSELTNVVSYQWYHLKNGKFAGATAIKDATKAEYTLTDDDAFEGIGVQVTSKEADGKTVVKEDILGNMATTVKASKDVKVVVSTDGKTEAKAAKVGDTLTALVTPSKASDQVEYQWYEVKTIDQYTENPKKNSTDATTYTKTTVTKPVAITGETQSTYKPTKAGVYGVEIRLSAAAKRAGFVTTDADSYDTVNMSAKDFTGVKPVVYDAYRENAAGHTAAGSTATDETMLNSVNHPYSFFVSNTLQLGKDYTVEWMIDHTDKQTGKVTTYHVVDAYGNYATTKAINSDDAGNGKGNITMRESYGKTVVPADKGDKLYVVITGAKGSVYEGQTAKSDAITLVKGQISDIKDQFSFTAVDDTPLTFDAHQYTATLHGADDDTQVAFYQTTDATFAASLVGGAPITDAQIAALKDLQAPSKQTAYTGNLNEGGVYTIAVVTENGYTGKLGFAATKDSDPDHLFQIEKNKGTDALAAANLVAEKYTGNGSDATKRINVTVQNAPQDANFKWFYGEKEDSITNPVTNLNPKNTNNNKDGEYGKVEITSGGKTRTITYSVSVKDSVGNIKIVSDTTDTTK